MKTIIALTLTLALGGLVASAAPKAAKTSPTIALAGSAWNITGSACMPGTTTADVFVTTHPLALNGMLGWYFDVPVNQPCYTGYDNGVYGTVYPAFVGYVTTKYQTSIVGKTSVSFTAQTLATSGTPDFFYATQPENTGIYPAHARIILQHVNDNGSDFQRWFSNPIAFALDNFDAETLTTPLDPSQWSSVFGHVANESSTTLAGFTDTLAHLGNVGLVFGGGYFFSHGVNVENGTARFVLTNFQVQ